MKKCLSLLIALSMIASICVFPVAAEETTWYTLPEGAELIFAEDFESGYETGVNLYGEGTTTVQKNGKDVLVLKNLGNFKEDVAYVKVNPVDGFDGNALELYTKNTTRYVTENKVTTWHTLDMDILFDGGNEIDLASNDRQLVFQYDVKTENYAEGAFMKVDSSVYQADNATGTKYTVTPYMYASNSGRAVRNGNYAGGTGAWYITKNISIANKTTLKHVFDQTGAIDVVRTYDPATNAAASINMATYTGKGGSGFGKDVIVKDFVAEDWWGTGMPEVNMSNPKSFYSRMYTKNASKPARAYIDNILVYSVPSIDFVEIGAKDNVDATKGIEVKFNVKPNATVNSFKITDLEGNDVAGATITDVTVEGNSAFVKVDGLAAATAYKLLIDDEFTSAAGALYHTDAFGISADEEWLALDNFTTNTPFELVEDVEEISGLIPNDPRAVEFKTTGTVASIEADLNGTALETLYNGNVATVMFADIAEPKSGTVNVKITAVDGQEIALAIPATSVADGFTTIFNDKLEGYAEGNLITDASGKTFTNGNLVFNTAAASLEAGGKSEIVTDPVQGKVLKLNTTGAGNHSVMYKPTGDAPSILGKVLVLKVKYNIPKSYTTNNGNAGAAAAVAPSATATGTSQTPDFRIRSGGGLGFNAGNYGNNYMEEGAPAINDRWFEVTTVIDQATAGTLTDPHVSRRYFDGVIDPIISYDKSAGETKADAHTMYDVPGQMYEGIWDFSKVAKAYENTAESKLHTKFGTNKMYGLYTAVGTADSATYLMIDDFQAYFADKFQITSISENQEAFVPTRHTLKVVFNQPIDQEQADSIELYTEAGEKVEGMVAAVANGGYAIDFTLPAVEPGAYKLSISPAFHDVRSFQGLGSKNHNYEIPVTVAEYVAFTAEAEPAEIIGFVNGKTTKAVVTLSAKTALVDSNAKSAFTVVNSKGEEITEGWYADVADDQMSITLEFSDLATDSYTITSNDKLVNKDGFGLDSADVVITIAPRQDKIILFEEDFEKGYDLDTDWLDAAPANGKFTAGYTRARADKTAYADDSITVTNNIPEGAVNANISGNALHIYAKQEATKVTKGIGVKGVMDPVAIATAYPGKVLVMEVDVFSPTTIGDGTKPIIASFNNNLAPGLEYYKHNGSGVKYEGTWFSYGTQSHTAGAWHTRWDMGHTSTDFKFVQVIDQRGDMDTVKMYVNGKIAKDTSNTLFADHPLYQQTIYEYPLKTNNTAADMDKYWGDGDAGTFYGPILLAQTYKDSKNVTCSDMYLDNIKVYLVDAFEITSIEGASTAYNAAKDTVKFNFTNKVKSLDNVAANIKLVDANGDVVENGVTYALAEGGFQVVATLNAAVIDGSAEYKFIVSPELQDEFGASLAHKYYDYDYVSNGGTAYIVKHNGSSADKASKFNNKDYVWVATEAEADALLASYSKAVKYPYTWTVDANGNATAENPLAPGTAGTVNANGWVRDEVAMKLVTVIKTTKATGLYAEATAAVVNGTNVSTSLTFTNPEEEALDVWYIVAAYGDYNEMIGCQAAALSVEKGSMAPIAINFTTKSSDIKSVKVYVWDGYKTMVPYQEAEELLK